MRIKDQLKLAFRAMTDRKLRTTLTIIGIVIGPATIVSLVAATQGYSAASAAQFDKLGATTMFVSPVGRSFSFTSSNVPQISNLLGVAAVVPYQELSGTITQGGQTVSVNIIGANLSALNEVFPSLSILNGSVPASDSLNEALIGYSIAYPNLSGATNSSVNQVLSVSNVRSGGGAGAIFFGPQGASFFGSSSSSSSSTTKSFLINGILSSFGQGLFIDPDTAVFIPISSSQTIEHSDTYNGVIVIASSVNEVSTVSSELTSLFGNNVRVTTVSSILSTVESVTSSTGTLLASIGSISVLVAFIAIMTTEFTSVMERTKEIGILKALGASARTILINFISESLVVGLLGGLIGAAIGSALSFFIIGFLSGNSIPGLGRGISGGARSAAVSPSSTTTLHIIPVITPELILLAVGLATLVGGLAGLLPAWRASRLTPVEALREA